MGFVPLIVCYTNGFPAAGQDWAQSVLLRPYQAACGVGRFPAAVWVGQRILAIGRMTVCSARSFGRADRASRQQPPFPGEGWQERVERGRSAFGCSKQEPEIQSYAGLTAA